MRTSATPKGFDELSLSKELGFRTLVPVHRWCILEQLMARAWRQDQANTAERQIQLALGLSWS
jgi:hypothetical protein